MQLRVLAIAQGYLSWARLRLRFLRFFCSRCYDEPSVQLSQREPDTLVMIPDLYSISIARRTLFSIYFEITSFLFMLV
jgi:hypothetical protein